jgi:hypothetical protein
MTKNSGEGPPERPFGRAGILRFLRQLVDSLGMTIEFGIQDLNL